MSDSPLPAQAVDAVKAALGAHGIDSAPGATIEQVSTTGQVTYKAVVPVVGHVLLDDLLESQGSLLYLRDGVEVSLIGFHGDLENRSGLLVEIQFRK